MPNCIILRGLPGSGKSSLAQELDLQIVSADRYFWTKEGYKFDAALLSRAHQACFDEFVAYLCDGRSVLVDNTNITKKEYQRYLDYARKHNHTIQIITVETDLTDEQLAARNVHGVPAETIKRMRERFYRGT